MNKMKYHSMFIFYYTVEMFVPLFIGISINIHNTSAHESHLLPLVSILSLLLVMSHFIAGKWQLSYIYFLVPFGIILLMLTGSYWLTAFLIAGYSVWTLEQMHDNINNHYNNLMLVIMLLLLLVINLIPSDIITMHYQLLHFIAAGMFVFYFLGRIIMLMAGSSYRAGSRLRVLVMSSLVLLGSAVLFTAVYNYIVFGIQTLFIFMLNGFVMMLRPFFSFLERVEFKFPEMEQEQMEVNDEGDAVEESFEGTAAISDVPVMTILLVLAAACIAVFLFMYFRKRSLPVKENRAVQTYKTAVTDNIPEEKRTESVSQPDSRVRKQYYAFEKWLAKKELGRYHGETVSEWAERMNIRSESNKEMIDLYKKYRYDSQELTADEFNEFKIMIKSLKRILDDKNN